MPFLRAATWKRIRSWPDYFASLHVFATEFDPGWDEKILEATLKGTTVSGLHQNSKLTASK